MCGCFADLLALCLPQLRPMKFHYGACSLKETIALNLTSPRETMLAVEAEIGDDKPKVASWNPAT